MFAVVGTLLMLVFLQVVLGFDNLQQDQVMDAFCVVFVFLDVLLFHSFLIEHIFESVSLAM